MSEVKTAASESGETKGANPKKDVVTMRELLECGVHFGHQTKRWDPRMRRYIFTSRNGIHVIDLQQTIKLIHATYNMVREIVKKNGTILFVGTKKQAQEAIQNEADRCGMPYVHHRWLGGTLTNNVTIRQSVHKLKDHIRMRDEGILDQLSNKEASRKRKTLTKLEYYLNGIKDMVKLPSAIFVVDTTREQLAIREANRLGIPIIGIVDTNSNPTEIQYPIPANDDAIRAIKLLCSVISNAVIDGQSESVSYVPEASITPNDANAASDGSVKRTASATKATPGTEVNAKKGQKKDSSTTSNNVPAKSST